MDKRKALKSLVDYDEEEDDNIGDDVNATQSQSSSQSQQSHSHSSHKIKSDPNLDTKKEKSYERHSHSNTKEKEKEKDNESKLEPKLSDKSSLQRSQKCSTNDRQDSRERHDKKYDTNRDCNYEQKNRKHYHNNDRESQRHSRVRRSRSRTHSRSRSRSRSRERYSKRDKYDDSRVKHCSRNSSNKCDRNDSKSMNRSQLTHTMQTMQQQIKASTGISVPNYYNVGVINPIKFAQQEQKRKLLWSRDDSKPQPETSALVASPVPALWNNTKFEGDKGSQMTEKFRKLMGIKDSSASVPLKDNEDNAKSGENAGVSESQETLFRNLDMQYAVARMSTHTHRGVGLGFGSATVSTIQTAPKSNAHN